MDFFIEYKFVVIPLLLVLSYYISLQVDTITLQNSYNTKLLDATYDAMSAFEINTANEDLSSVSDSLRTIIEASNNVFFNTLATNMGLSNASKSYIEPYIPAVLYTLYDGYYIFAPTSIPQVMTDLNGVAVSAGDDYVEYKGDGTYEYNYDAEYNFGLHYFEPSSEINPATIYKDDEDNYLEKPEDYGQLLYLTSDSVRDPHVERNQEVGNVNFGEISKQTLNVKKLTTDPNKAEKRIKNVLKSYMPYSARYRSSGKLASDGTNYKTVFGNSSISYDINVVYTLDNYVSFEGFVQKGSDVERIYYSESGYLLKGNNDKVEVEIDGAPIINTDAISGFGSSRYSQNEIQSIIEGKTASSPKVTVTIGEREGANITLSTDDIEELNDARIDYYNGVYDGVRSILLESDRWDEKSLKEQYEILLTVLKNKQDEIENNSDTLGVNQVDLTKAINRAQYSLDLMSSITYYAKAKIFTNWVNTHMSMIQAKDLVQIAGIDYGTISEGLAGTDETDNRDFMNQLDFRNDNTYIFNSNAFGENGGAEVANNQLTERDSEGRVKLNEYSVTEISQDSNYYTHKLRVIRSAIQYSLNLAMSVYNSNESYGLLSQSQIFSVSSEARNRAGYAMPVLSYDEWEKITENPSIVAFMQGLKCGLKVYNNYEVVSSTNNEIVVHPEQVYYVPIDKDNYDGFNTGGLGTNDVFYHRIDCSKLNPSDKIMSFSSKEVKYDKIYDKNASSHKYKYDHKNLACYDCINDGNYIGDDYINIFDTSANNNLRRAFYMGVGRVRNDTYKMNAFATSSGYQTVYNFEEPLTSSSLLPLKEIEAIRLTFGYTYDLSNSIDFQVCTSTNTLLSDSVFSIPANNKIYTIEVRLKDFTEGSDTSTEISKGNISLKATNGNTETNKNLNTSLKFIEVVYK